LIAVRRTPSCAANSGLAKRVAHARQWLIIHGRRPLAGLFSAPGCALPLAPARVMREPLQQPHPDGWPAVALNWRGSFAARSLVAWALRCVPDISASAGALIMRDTLAPQSGQCIGRSRAATLRITANGPHVVH
jgi:hypothetical protein